jgi:type IV pilus assembly protein PilC
MKLAYTAYDGLGKTTTGVVEADDVVAAADALRRKGLYVAELTQQAARTKRSSRRRARRGSSGQKLKNLAMFSRQLYVLVSSGTPLVAALRAVERQTGLGPWRAVISDLRTRVEEGASLSEAMEAHGSYFDSVYRSLIAAGESSGHLLEMLDRLAALKQKQLRVRNSIVGALIYPCMLLGLGLTIFALLLLFVVPRFAVLFKTLDVPLPASTDVLVQTSIGFRRYWWLVAFAALAYLRTPKGRRLRDIAILRLPYIGSIAKSFATARIVCLLGVLMQARVPVLEALRLVRLGAGNIRYRELISKAEDYVARGEPMSLALSDTALISPSVHEVIRSGEESGEIDRLLLNISAFLDEENEVIVRSLTAIIEPVILIFMGLLVGLISVCMFMPLFDLTAMTQGGA